MALCCRCSATAEAVLRSRGLTKASCSAPSGWSAPRRSSKQQPARSAGRREILAPAAAAAAATRSHHWSSQDLLRSGR
eukprot:5848400-Alexandrium_andersonii.AAC.1